MQGTRCIPYKFKEFVQVALLVSNKTRLWKSFKFMNNLYIYIIQIKYLIIGYQIFYLFKVIDTFKK
jgi:hypothetical protein